MKKPSADKRVVIPGFKFSSVSAGIKKTGKKDIALIFSETPSVTAGVFTTNKIKAAPVKLSMARINRKRTCQAIIINSGNANACTGLQGIKDAKETAEITAKGLKLSPELVCAASTGIIGRLLPMRKIRKAIPEAIKKLSPSAIREAALAIMTTDTFQKIYSTKINVGGKKGTIAGIAKGAGMICPNMATMLAFIVTDIAIEPKALDSALRGAVKKSFNRLTVDNDMSTNDTVLVMANGMLKNSLITKSSPSSLARQVYVKFEDALTEVSYNLSKMIALDGEGATKLVEIIVRGAETEADAEKVAKSIANSMLVKTAIYGKDPNWGRIMAAIGYSGVRVDENKINISINRVKLVSKGAGIDKTKTPKNLFSGKEILITAELGLGKKEVRVLTCDLTEKYVKINADYMT
jgi:glutamate N-acetyltransferase/amino-acid N-acetyltransferase